MKALICILISLGGSIAFAGEYEYQRDKAELEKLNKYFADEREKNRQETEEIFARSRKHQEDMYQWYQQTELERRVDALEWSRSH